ncbi:MAG: hypothetical protein ACOYYI_09450 [Chloroflexota bacterium]
MSNSSDLLNLLNAVDASEGWQEKGGMLVSKKGDIIDFAPAIRKWFIIAKFGVFEGYETREDAVKAYIEKRKMKST